MKRILSFVTVAAVAAASLASPNTAAAQWRAPWRVRPLARTGHAVARPAYRYPAYRPSYRYAYPYRGYAYGYPYYGYPYYGTSFAFGIGFGFGWGYPYYGYSRYGYGYPYYGGAYGYPYGGPYPYQYGYYDYRGAARLEVKPREAEVFIDGYFVGAVDNFDGWAQRLNVAPGEHELVIYLKGHHTFRQNVLFRPGATLRVEHVMQPLAPGDAEEPRPVAGSNRRPRPARRDPRITRRRRTIRRRRTTRGNPATPCPRRAEGDARPARAVSLSTARWRCACSRSTPR